MSALCILDTSILLELLAVPGKVGQLEKIKTEMAQKITAGESLFLPMASVFETGNHIGQNGDGTLRRECAAWSLDGHLSAYDRAGVKQTDRK